MQDVHLVSRVGQQPCEATYPWVEQRVWYDPKEFPNIHLAHWHFWNNHRCTFWEWWLHVSFDGKSAQTQRRKRKMAALRARTGLFSLCIEAWGYYKFLRKFDSSSGAKLMWMGGGSGRNSKGAKKYCTVPVTGLVELYQNDRPAYLAKIENAITPFGPEKGGFANIPLILEHMCALNPDEAEPDKRMSYRALVRIRMDIQSSEPTEAHWKGTPGNRDWLALSTSTKIATIKTEVKKALKEGTYTTVSVPDYDRTEARTPGFSPFLNTDGTYTALPPADDYEENSAPGDYEGSDCDSTDSNSSDKPSSVENKKSASLSASASKS